MEAHNILDQLKVLKLLVLKILNQYIKMLQVLSGFTDFIGDVVLQTENVPGFNLTDVFQFSAPDGLFNNYHMW